MIAFVTYGGTMFRTTLSALAALAALSLITGVVACASNGEPRRPSFDGGSRDGGRRDTGTPFDLGAVDLFSAEDLSSDDLGAIDDLGVDSDLGAMEADLGSVDLGAADLGMHDLGASDLGAPDLGPPVGCTSAASCQDGLACNGVEACIAGRCRPGTAIVCDDGISCTTNTCSEPAGTCAFVRNDAACPAGSTCTAPTASGCTSTTMCSESPCRLVAPQCGCTAGQACTVSGSTRTCAAAGTGATGTACTPGGAGCVAGDVCVGVSASGTPSACEHFCSSDANCTGAGALCILGLGDGLGGTVPGVSLCSISCNPLTGGGCPSGGACRIYVEAGPAGRYLTHCEGPVGFGTEFSPCATDANCAAGFACLDVGFGNECTRWCNYTTGTGCDVGFFCDDVFTVPAIIGSRQYGVCT